MKSWPFCFVLFLALMISTDIAYGQNSAGAKPKRARTLADYTRRTFSDIEAAGSSLISGPDNEGSSFVHGDLFPSQIRLAYKGPTRPLPNNKKDLIRSWAQRYAGDPSHYTVPYQTDMLFTEDGVAHWLTVKNDLLPRLKRELKKGASVDLYAIRLGAIKTGKKWTWVLLVENFAKP